MTSTQTQAFYSGDCKTRNETETKQKRNETSRNETKQDKAETKRTETRHNRNETEPKKSSISIICFLFNRSRLCCFFQKTFQDHQVNP